jgi:hypothetical protein
VQFAETANLKVLHYTPLSNNHSRKLQYSDEKMRILRVVIEIVVGKDPRGPCKIMRNIAYLRKKGLRDPPVFVGVTQYIVSRSGDCLTDAAYASAVVGGLEGVG